MRHLLWPGRQAAYLRTCLLLTRIRFSQGISKLYAQTGQWDKHAESLDSLVHIFAKRYCGCKRAAYGRTLTSTSDDATKCAETLQKYVDVCKQHSGPLQVWVEALGKGPYLTLLLPQVVTALALYLPTSDLYPVLSALPPPDATNPD